MSDPTPIRIFDTTLRDGEQSPGASLNLQEKRDIARQLDLLGVDVIEAGFPITSNGDFESVHTIANEIHRPIIAGLARCVPADIDRAGEALVGCAHPRIHVFCATSKIHREFKLKKAFEEIIKLAVDSVKRARQHCEDVEFSPEDGSRTELNYLADITAAVIEAGATTVNIPDTVGYAVPEQYGHIFKYVRQQVPAIDAKNIYLSAHCHNDLGMAVANSMAAMQNGARQIECTINGIGERAGNASLEEIVMLMRTRADYYSQYSNAINSKRIWPLSKMVAAKTGLHVQRNKAIVGENAFAHESGIHQDGMLKNPTTYEIMNPLDVGIPESKLVLGKHSGRHAFRERVTALGFAVTDEQLQNAFEAFKTLADKKKDVYDEDIEVLLEQLMSGDRQMWVLKQFQVTSGNMALPTATVVLIDAAGVERMEAAVGDGPIDSVYTAIQRITGVSVDLLDYQSRAVTVGKDAQGQATVELRHNGRKVRGRGVSTDVIEAAARAYLAAINRIQATDARTVKAVSPANDTTQIGTP